MPPAAYKNMWEHLKAGRPWMGIVKNRCKNGDYYWVHAYVTPVAENGVVVGYESVRVKPHASDVARATRLYNRLNRGGSLKSWRDLRSLIPLLFGLPVLVGLAFLLNDQVWPAFILASLSGLGYAGYALREQTGF